jgi:DGQHR domain-containing protein
VLFHAAAGEINQWADVDRLGAENPTGAQRPLRRLKVGKVARYLSASRMNTIPTAIIVALDRKCVSFPQGRSESGKAGTLVIKMTGDSRPGLIIDGQHRTFGAEKYSPDMHLNVVAFLGGDDTEAAFQFVVINNTAQRVSRDHIKALNLNYDKELLNKRLLMGAGLALGLDDTKYEDLQVMDLNQPFKGLISWPRNEDGFIPPNALESALAETRDRAARLGVEGLERDVFLALWSKVKALRPEQWRPLPKSRLLLKVSIYALTVFVLDSLVAAQTVNETPIDFTDDETLDRYVERLVKMIPAGFWTAEWSMTELDTRSGRETLVKDLQVISSNNRHGRTWYESLSTIDAGSVAGVAEAPVARRRKRVARKK